MGNQAVDVSVDTQSVRTVATAHEVAYCGQRELANSLEEVNNELFERWKGEAGDKFKLAGTYMATLLKNIAKKNKKYSYALVDISNQFETLDQELANGIKVEVKSPSKGGKA